MGELKYHGAKFLHLKVMGENQIEIILGGETLCKPWLVDPNILLLLAILFY